MATDMSQSQYVGFLVPYQESSADIWDAESSYLQDGAAPGNITPASRSRLRLSATGSQGTTSYVLTTRRGGHIFPGEAGFTWRKSTDPSNGTNDRGWDPPVVITGYRPLAWSTAVLATRRHPDRCVLPDGSVGVVASVQTGSDHTVKFWRITGDGTATSPVDIYTTTTAPSAQMDSHLSPSICLDSEGAIIVGHMVEDQTAEEAQWRVHRSTDSGVTWSTASSEALPEPISVDNNVSGAGFFINRCRMRMNRGYTLLIVEMVASNTGAASRHAYRQYASTSEGTRFDLVEEMSQAIATAGGIATINFGRTDAANHGGGFVVCNPVTIDSLRVYRLADAYDPISGAEQFNHSPSETVATVTSAAYSDGNTSIWSAPDTSLYLAWRDVSGNSECRVARATALDSASPFSTLGEGTGTGGGGAAWWDAGTAGTYPDEFVGVSALGRSLVYAHVEATTTTTYEGSLVELHLGGWSTVNMPGLDALAPETRRAGWTHSGFPFELPGNTVWTTTSSGTPTQSLAQGKLQSDASGGTLYYSVTPTCAIGETLIGEWAVTLNSGTAPTTSLTSGIRVAVEGGAAGYETQVRIGYAPDIIAVYDGISGAQLGSNVGVDWSNIYEIRIEQRGSACQVWYRQRNLASDREWTQITQTSGLTSSGGGGSNLIRWGVGHASTTSASDWYGWSYTAGDDNARQALPLTFPADLFARDYAGLGASVYVEGVLVSAVGGPARENESTTLAPKYGDQRGSIDNALYATATPRRTWRTPPIDPVTGNTAQQTIAFQTGPSGAESYPLTEVIGAHIVGATFCTGAIQRKDTSSGWANIYVFDLCTNTGFTGTTYGQTIRPTSGSTGRWLDRDEFRGGWLRMGASAPYTWRKIRAHSPGILGAPASGLAVTIEIDGADGTEPTGPVAMAIVPPEVTVLVHTNGETAEGLRINVAGQNCAEGAVEAGCLWLGYVVVPGQRWELGSRTATVGGAEVIEGSDRVDYARELAPVRREMEVGWQALNVSAPLQGATADPNYILGSELGSARPLSARDSAVGDVVGLVRRCRGSLVPVVALTRIRKLTGSTNGQVIDRRDEQLRGRFTGPVSVRHITGDEGSNADGLAYRLESVPLTEIV